MASGVSTARLGGERLVVFLPTKRLMHLFEAEADLPTEDDRLLPKEERDPSRGGSVSSWPHEALVPVGPAK